MVFAVFDAVRCGLMAPSPEQGRMTLYRPGAMAPRLRGLQREYNKELGNQAIN
jgi:hypothetical protein